MIITLVLKNKKAKKYDLTKQADITQFKRIITLSITSKNSNLLKDAKRQLEVLKKIPLVTEQLRRIETFLATLKESNETVPPPPTAVPVTNASLKEEELTIELVPLQSEIAENGETSFQTLYAYLMYDMAKYTGDIKFLAWYSAIVINMFIHVATFTPQEGYGKAQLREFNNKSQLQYFRSQGNHIDALLFRDLIKAKGERRACRLPFNKGFFKLIGREIFSQSFCAELKKIDPETGFPKAGTEKVNSYVMAQVAHAGARKNNFSTMIAGMTKVVDGLAGELAREALQNKLIGVLPPKKKIIALETRECGRRTRALFSRFDALRANFEANTTVNKNLSSHLLNYRIDRVRTLQQQLILTPLKHIKIDDSHRDITCLMIQLYPACQKDNDTYKEGVTNVLLSFFGALLNYHAHKKGLHLHTERRQSFGFLRPTLTDAGCLMLRLSLGLEPKVFDEIVLESLKEFDDILGKFKFDDETHETVKKVFEHKPPKEKKEEGKRTRASDTYIRNVVRKDDRTLTTFRQAHNYIDQAAADAKNGDFLEKAMKNFLDNYVRGGIKLPTPAAKDQENPDIVQPCSSQVVNLLKNVLDYVFRFVSKLEFLEKDEPLASFSHVYYHSLLKLFNNCNEAKTLLNDIAKIEASEFHRRATLLIENILEYLISLDSLRQIRAGIQQKPVDPIAQLRDTELTHTAKSLQVPVKQMQLFFTDSGQQAITTALLTLSFMLHGPAADGKTYDRDIHLFGKSYFEVAEFMKDCRKDHAPLENPILKHAKIVFIDITQLSQLHLDDCQAMKALVVDMTHHPVFDQDLLKQVISVLQQRGTWVTLVESALKHEQLGLDKYQTGRITTLAPPGQKLSPEATEQFEIISSEAIHPSIASYLQMVNEICCEKVDAQVELKEATAPTFLQQQRDKTSTQAMLNRGFGLSVKTPALKPVEHSPASERGLTT